jgi:hypothetical protein
MRNLEGHTRLRPNEVLDRALAYFGPKGLGLQTAPRQFTRVEFQGGAGVVVVSVLLDLRNGSTTVGVTSREWDRKAEDFLASLPPPRGRLWRCIPVLRRMR